MIHQTLQDRLQSALDERNWSQTDGAIAAGVSLSTLQKILCGKRSPTLNTLVKIIEGWRIPDLLNDLKSED